MCDCCECLQLITYKVLTIGQDGQRTGQQPGSLDSARGSSGYAPQTAGQPPPLSPGKDSQSDFEGVQVWIFLTSFPQLHYQDTEWGICHRGQLPL